MTFGSGAAGKRIWFCLLAGLLAVVITRWQLDRAPSIGVTQQSGREASLSAEVVRRLNPGFWAVMADWYWIRALIFAGGRAQQNGRIRIEELPRLKGLLRRAVTLDSRHLPAWRFGAMMLSEVDPDEAIRFIREGIRGNPSEWRLVADEAFILWRAGRYLESAQSWQRGASLPAAPRWLEPMAAIVFRRGGDLETAQLILQHLIETTDDRFVREVCLAQLERLRGGGGSEAR